MKPRILIANKFYYRRGGDCVYALNLERLLREHGHEVAVYSMQYPDNLPGKWNAHFATQVDFSAPRLSDKLEAVRRVFGKGNIGRSFNRILDEFRPDIVHLNNIHSYLSPVLAEIAHKRGIKVVWTLHDYKLICPSYSCLRDGRPCEECFSGNHRAVLSHRCMKGSLAASAIAWLEARKWHRKRLESCVDTFICPSEFMASKMAHGGFDRAKLKVVNNFIGSDIHPVPSDTQDYYCYIGRLSSEKGIETLLEAAKSLPYPLVVAGDGPMFDDLYKRYNGGNIKMLGRVDASNVSKLLSGARMSVIPSAWYENNPFSIIESHCLGTPVVGSRIGGIPELIDPTNGIVCEPFSAGSLREAITRAWETAWDRPAISATAQIRYSPQTHYAKLEEMYRLASTTRL